MDKDCVSKYKTMWHMAKAILTDRQYEVFSYIGREGMTLNQVSKKTGLSVVRVGQLWHTASDRIKEEWSRYVFKN